MHTIGKIIIAGCAGIILGASIVYSRKKRIGTVDVDGTIYINTHAENNQTGVMDLNLQRTIAELSTKGHATFKVEVD